MASYRMRPSDTPVWATFQVWWVRLVNRAATPLPLVFIVSWSATMLRLRAAMFRAMRGIRLAQFVVPASITL